LRGATERSDEAISFGALTEIASPAARNDTIVEMLQIKLDKFEGPLGLLLQIVEKEEMDIAEVSLAKIADQYVEYIKKLDKINPGEMADFLVVAAKLLLIKSKALLPYLQPEEEEEIQELEDQLRMYKEFLEATKKIESLVGKKRFMFAREFSRKAILANAGVFFPPQKLKKENLKLVFKEIISRIRPVEEKLEEEELEHKVNIEDKILTIQKMLIERIKVSFDKVLGNAKSKTEIIVSFLAMLELIKQRDIAVKQDGLFKEIVINKS